MDDVRIITFILLTMTGMLYMTFQSGCVVDYNVKTNRFK